MSAVLQAPGGNLRCMLEADLDVVMEIEIRVYEYPWTRGIFEDCLRMGYGCWVYEQNDSVVAYGVITTAARESHLLNLSVSPHMQRTGLGRNMLEHLIENARRQNADTLLLEVRPSNLAALCLYENANFHEIGLRKNYYPARTGHEDALILARTLR